MADMSDDIEFRMARDGDIPSLAVVWHDSWHASHAALLPDAAPHRDLPYFKARIASNLARTMVALDGEDIAGFSGWEGDGIAQVFVAPAHFRRQIGTRLLSTVEAILKSQGHGKIWLHCAEGNEGARALYEKQGWRVEKTFDDEIGTHLGPMPMRTWHMVKQL